jgi:hypothetical protein
VAAGRPDFLDRVGVGAFGLALEAWHLGEELGGVTPERGPVEEPRGASNRHRAIWQRLLFPVLIQPLEQTNWFFPPVSARFDLQRR